MQASPPLAHIGPAAPALIASHCVHLCPPLDGDSGMHGLQSHSSCLAACASDQSASTGQLLTSEDVEEEMMSFKTCVTTVDQ